MTINCKEEWFIIKLIYLKIKFINKIKKINIQKYLSIENENFNFFAQK